MSLIFFFNNIKNTPACVHAGAPMRLLFLFVCGKRPVEPNLADIHCKVKAVFLARLNYLLSGADIGVGAHQLDRYLIRDLQVVDLFL